MPDVRSNRPTQRHRQAPPQEQHRPSVTPPMPDPLASSPKPAQATRSPVPDPRRLQRQVPASPSPRQDRHPMPPGCPMRWPAWVPATPEPSAAMPGRQPGHDGVDDETVQTTPAPPAAWTGRVPCVSASWQAAPRAARRRLLPAVRHSCDPPGPACLPCCLQGTMVGALHRRHDDIASAREDPTRRPDADHVIPHHGTTTPRDRSNSRMRCLNQQGGHMPASSHDRGPCARF